VVSFTPRPLYPRGKSPRYPLDRRLGGPQSRSGRGGEKKHSRPLPELEPPIIQPVAQRYTTDLPWLRPTSLRPILILSSNRQLGISSSLFPSSFPTNILCAFLLESANVIIFGGEQKLSSSLCNFLHSPVTSSSFGANILLYFIPLE
jgi:hypothetical protein